MSSPPSPAADLSPVARASFGILGSGGHAGVVAAAARRQGLVLETVFDADHLRHGQAAMGVVIQPETALADHPDLPLHIAIGDNAIRRRISAQHPTARWLTLVDPDACLAVDVAPAEGGFVAMGAKVQTGVRFGRHVIVNTGAIVDHDCRIGDFVHIAPGVILCGGVVVGAEAMVGAGSVILPGLTIGQGAVVGAGAVVTCDVRAGDTVVGAPARPLGTRTEPA